MLVGRSIFASAKQILRSEDITAFNDKFYFFCFIVVNQSLFDVSALHQREAMKNAGKFFMTNALAIRLTLCHLKKKHFANFPTSETFFRGTNENSNEHKRRRLILNWMKSSLTQCNSDRSTNRATTRYP